MPVIQRGHDVNGRPIRESAACWAVWDAACAELGFVPTIVQGGFMGDAGADASAGTHAGDAFDLRLWDRTAAERDRMIRVFREHAFAYWERYETQGFDLHAHLIPGPWASPAPQALDQWHAYVGGRNGLASNGPDYHLRPKPLVLTPPEEDKMTPAQEKLLTETAAAVKRIEERLDQIGDRSYARDEGDRRRDERARKQLVELRKRAATAADVAELRETLDAVLAELGATP